MLTKAIASQFADAWVAAWNARDLPRILAHYADDFVMESPLIASVAGEASGVLRGKQAVGAYWQAALDRFPDLRLALLGVHVGARSIVIRYRSVLGLVACETLEFNEAGLVVRACAHYNETDLAEAAADQTWMAVSHLTPILNVSDLFASMAWFEKLGWRTCWTWGEGGAGPTFGAVGAGECEIFLCQNGQGGRGKGANRSTFTGAVEDDSADKGCWMSVWVMDVDAVHARCVAEGLEVTHPPTNEPWGVREMHVRHPDGHVLRISKGIGAG
jgi:catechol 2,3-dioxygenase-like lactoylglutathione lyase family enzyme